MALAKLQSGDDVDEEEEDEDEEDSQDGSPTTKSVRLHLIHTLRTDPSAEVRRAALFNLPIDEATLPFVMERLRDVDVVNRRCVYLGTLSNALNQPGPSQLSNEQSHEVVKTGLGEREETVKKACKKLISAWSDKDGGDPWKLLDRLDGLDYPESTMAALKSAFETRPNLVDAINLDDEFWSALTPNTALLARSLIEHLKAQGRAGETRMEEVMPLVMALAFRMQAVWEGLLHVLTEGTDDEEAEDLAAAQASILESLLHLALSSDYGDEIGRRKMFGLIREIVSHPLLPRGLIEPCTDVLLKLSAGQRDFVRIVVEIVQELGDEYDDDLEEEAEEDEDRDADEVEDLVQGPSSGRARRHSMEPEDEELKAQRRAISDARRLLLVRAMLERMASNLHENTAIHGLIPQLIAPAVKSKDATVREQGLFCLGLCCLLDAKLALDTFPLFIDQIQRATGDIKLRATQIVFDSMLVHGIPYLSSRQAQAAGGGPEAEIEAYSQIVNFLLSLLEDDEEPIQAVAAEGMAKLMLSGMVEDEEALRSLILVYMSPETIANQEMRQCLGYFLPVYCFSSSANQRRLQRVLVPILQLLTEVYQEQTSGSATTEMVTPAQVGQQLLDWTDPGKALNLVNPTEDACLHLDVGLDLLQCLFNVHDTQETRNIVNLLSKLSLPEVDKLGSTRGKTLFLLCAKLKEVNPFEDSVARNALSKFEVSCAKKYPEAAKAAKSTDLQADEELENLRVWFEEAGMSLAIDEKKVMDSEAVLAQESKAKAKRRASPAPSTTKATSGGRRKATPPPPLPKVTIASTRGKRTTATTKKSKKQESSEEEEEDDEESEDAAASTVGAESEVYSDDELGL